MASFNADQYLAAIEKPTFTIHGKTHTGRLLSLLEFMPLYARIEGATMTPAESLQISAEYLALIFPKPPRWMFWRKWIGLDILALPNVSQVVAGFLEVQLAAMTTKTPSQQTNGKQPVEKPLATELTPDN